MPIISQGAIFAVSTTFTLEDLMSEHAGAPDAELAAALVSEVASPPHPAPPTLDWLAFDRLREIPNPEYSERRQMFQIEIKEGLPGGTYVVLIPKQATLVSRARLYFHAGVRFPGLWWDDTKAAYCALLTDPASQLTRVYEWVTYLNHLLKGQVAPLPPGVRYGTALTAVERTTMP